MCLNVEGFIRTKSDNLDNMFNEADVLAQETHVPSDETSCLREPGFNIVDYKGHIKQTSNLCKSKR